MGAAPEEWRHVFASIQSLGRAAERISPRMHFEVVVVDEFHHAGGTDLRARSCTASNRASSSASTATPERADGRSVLEWFGGRIAGGDPAPRGPRSPAPLSFPLLRRSRRRGPLGGFAGAGEATRSGTSRASTRRNNARVRLVLQTGARPRRGPARHACARLLRERRACRVYGSAIQRSRGPARAISAETSREERRTHIEP